MAQLNSPGVSVTVIDESFYTPSAPGTVPLIVVASAESKPNGAKTGIAPGTLKANAGKVFLLTSQKDLSDTFGTPYFETDANNNPVHAGELNEYGLQAAYSFLGVSNRAYVVRADVDLAQLDRNTDIPAGLPEDGTFWLDTYNTQFGIFQWNGAPASQLGGQTFSVQKPTVITDVSKVDVDNDNAPKPSFGAIGSYAVVAVSNLVQVWYKKPATTTPVSWVKVGSPEWKAGLPVAQGTNTEASMIGPLSIETSDTLVINGISITGVNSMSALVTAINTGGVGSTPLVVDITAVIVNSKFTLFTSGADVDVSGSMVSKLGLLSTTYREPSLQISPHYQVPDYKAGSGTTSAPSGSIWIKTTTPNAGAHWFVKKYSEKLNEWTTVSAPLYKNNAAALKALDPTGGGIHLAANSIYVKFNDSEVTITQHGRTYPALANFKVYRRQNVGPTSIVSAIITNTTYATNDYSFAMQETLTNSDELSAPVIISFVINDTDSATVRAGSIADAINASGLTNVIATITSTNQIVISHVNGGDIKLADVNNDPLEILFGDPITGTNVANFYGGNGSYLASNWSSIIPGSSDSFIIPHDTAPDTMTANGTMWYDPTVTEVDIMVHNGTTWVGYLDATAVLLNQSGTPNETGTDPKGPIVGATKPLTQSDGTPLAHNDIWIDTSDLENYPLIYKYNLISARWVLVDNTDQTSEHGIVFHDARWSTAGDKAEPASIEELLHNNFLDPDAPDPALYPKGMLLWNLRRSGNNVKEFVYNYIDVNEANHRYNYEEPMTTYFPHRWISIAANQSNGAGSFGRKAQRTVVLQAMTALINSNQQIRDEDSRVFNLLSAPGYIELLKPLVGLNYDRGLTAFIVGDTPARLTPDATTLSNWGQNVNNALEDGDEGLITTDPYVGMFYPWGYSTDNIGNKIAVPPSHIMLRTIALSDNVSYPWFAPAGSRRGGITNASNVGYVDAEGEFVAISLNNGQRDVLASINVNPLTYLNGIGLVNYGQKTRQLVPSAMDRINVVRLVIYMRTQLEKIARPFIFEPNDKITRDQIKQQIESFLLELVGQRALYDFIVQCDTINNTPTRIDRNELFVDIAIEPVKAIEMIYIPLRLENTGAIAKLGK